MCAWSVNELRSADRRELLASLGQLAEQSHLVLVLEPIARSATPWWDDWKHEILAAGGRADEWRFDAALPPALAELDEAAGFRREALSAKSLLLRR